MIIMERDPIYIAQQIKFIRKFRNLTQENLADAAGLTTRTIEKSESGRHAPNEQTLRSIARAMSLNVEFFEKPTVEQQKQQAAELERVARKTVLIPTAPIITTSDFLAAFKQRDAFRIDTSAVIHEAALDTVAIMSDWFEDMDCIWRECSNTQKLEYARSFIELCQTLDTQGYTCYMGHDREQLRQKDRSPLIFDVGLMSVLPKDGVEGIRYAMVQLEGNWESLESDRSAFS